MGNLLTVSAGQGSVMIRVYTKVSYVQDTEWIYTLPLTKIVLHEYDVTDNCTGGTNIYVPAVWDTIPGPYWIAITFLYGYVDNATDIGYWTWVWTLAGATSSPLAFNCDSAPGNPAVINGIPHNKPVIGHQL